MASTTLDTPRVSVILGELEALAARNDPEIIAAARAALYDPAHPFDDQDPRLAPLVRDAALPVSRAVGGLLYVLARACGSRLTVEFGTSFGISTIYLAAAARDLGGRVITTEIDATKAARARKNLEHAGLLDVVELRVGDARETLRDLPGPVDMIFLDGWKSVYLPVLQLVEPRLRQHAFVVADNLQLMPDLVRPFVDHIRRSGDYFSIELPNGDDDRLSLALKI